MLSGVLRVGSRLGCWFPMADGLSVGSCNFDRVVNSTLANQRGWKPISKVLKSFSDLENTILNKFHRNYRCYSYHAPTRTPS
jgi:hypothetical protein